MREDNTATAVMTSKENKASAVQHFAGQINSLIEIEIVSVETCSRFVAAAPSAGDRFAPRWTMPSLCRSPRAEMDHARSLSVTSHRDGPCRDGLCRSPRAEMDHAVPIAADHHTHAKMDHAVPAAVDHDAPNVGTCGSHAKRPRRRRGATRTAAEAAAAAAQLILADIQIAACCPSLLNAANPPVSLSARRPTARRPNGRPARTPTVRQSTRSPVNRTRPPGRATV